MKPNLKEMYKLHYRPNIKSPWRCLVYTTIDSLYKTMAFFEPLGYEMKPVVWTFENGRAKSPLT